MPTPALRAQTLQENLKRRDEGLRARARTRRKPHPSSDRVFAELIEMRIRRGLTQADVADRIGTTQSAISRLEDRRTGSPTLRTLERYADAVGCRLELRVFN